MSLAPPFGEDEDVRSADGLDEIVRTLATCFALPLLGLPGISVPTGVVDGLPTGVQLIAGHFREDLVLDAAEIIEWHCPMATPIDPRF